VIHIVICDNKDNELEKIINRDRKVLLRGGISRRIPHSRIFVNVELYFLEKGSNVSKYHAVVTDAINYSKLINSEISDIYDKYKDKLNLSKKEENKWLKKCMCIIEFDKLVECDEITIPTYTNLEDWIMVDSLNDLNNR